MRAGFRFITEVFGLLGGLASIFIWLKLEPSGFRKVGAIWPHWMWLVAGLLLFVVGLSLSLYELVRGPRFNQEAIRRFERAGALRSKAGQADWLAKRLEEIWHSFNNEQKPLKFPLGRNAIPDVIKDWTDRQLWSFRVLYQSHIGAVTAIDPDCKTDLIKDGFPCDGQDYLTVMRKLKAHAESLRSRANQLQKGLSK
jgi:hypothetical protein